MRKTTSKQGQNHHGQTLFRQGGRYWAATMSTGKHCIIKATNKQTNKKRVKTHSCHSECRARAVQAAGGWSCMMQVGW